MAPEPLENDLSDLPKAELHCHIEGTASPDLVRKIARRNDLPLGDLITDDNLYRWQDFTSFLQAYDRAAAVFVTEQDYSDLAYDYFTRSAAEGMIYGEVFISADHAENAGLSYKAYVEALADGLLRARQECGVEGRMIATCVRHYGPERAVPVARLCTAHPHPLVTGFGMAGDERMHHPSDFAAAFEIAHGAGLHLTAHAGEFAGPDSVRAVLDELYVKRIGHGVRVIEDTALMNRLANEQIVLEVCPGSNVALGVFEDWVSHPLPKLMAAGIPVTINSDDPPFFQSSIGHEYTKAAEIGLMSAEGLLGLTRTAINAAFTDPATKQRLLKRVNLYEGSG